MKKSIDDMANIQNGKPENDLGWKMVQVCIKENGPGFQNIEIDRKMV